MAYYLSARENPSTNRRGYIQDTFNHLHKEHAWQERKTFVNNINALSTDEHNMVQDAFQNKKYTPYRMDYVQAGKSNLPKNQVSFVIDQTDNREIKTSQRHPSIDTLPHDKIDKLYAYRFGSDRNRYAHDAKCPNPHKYTPIMYDKRDTKTWPWQVNPNFEDPVVDRFNRIKCCDINTRQYTSFDNKFVSESQHCEDLYKDYKKQERKLTTYINRFLPPLGPSPAPIVTISPNELTNMDYCSGINYEINYIGDRLQRNVQLTIPASFTQGEYHCLLNTKPIDPDNEEKKEANQDEKFLDLASFNKANNVEEIVEFTIPAILKDGHYQLYVVKDADRQAHPHVKKFNKFRDANGKPYYTHYDDDNNYSCIKAVVRADGRNIFEVIDLCKNGIASLDDEHIKTLVLETYHLFFSQSTRTQHFEQCVCRGDYGHQKINNKIEEIIQKVQEMLQVRYHLSEQEVQECLGADGILTNLSEAIDKYWNPTNWLATACKKLREWIAFNYKAAERIKLEDPTKRLRDTTFYKIIQHVIKSLLKQIATSNEQIKLLDLLPTSKDNTASTTIHSPTFFPLLTYLCKEKYNLDALLSIPNLVVGVECDADSIATFFYNMMSISRTLAREEHINKYSYLISKLAKNLSKDCVANVVERLNKTDFKTRLIREVYNSKRQTTQGREEYDSFTQAQKSAFYQETVYAFLNPVQVILMTVYCDTEKIAKFLFTLTKDTCMRDPAKIDAYLTLYVSLLKKFLSLECYQSLERRVNETTFKNTMIDEEYKLKSKEERDRFKALSQKEKNQWMEDEVGKYLTLLIQKLD